jgi:predicted enzyme related to lactoylglutathione lyase
MSSPFVWWEVETPAPSAFMEFHGALCGWRFAPAFAGTELGRDYWIIQSDGTGIGGLQRGSVAPSAGVRFYLEVDDLEACLARAVELGATIERGRTALGGDDRWFANVLDPSGISFGLWTAAG